MFGHRIELARKRSGVSLRTLSATLGGRPSPQVIRKIEKDEITPDGELLEILSKTLDVTIEFLMSGRVSRLEDVEIRKLTSTSVRDRARVEVEVIDQLDRYLSIELVLKLEASRWDPPFPPALLENEDDAESVARRLRKAWALDDKPIPDLTELLEAHGLKVLVIPLPASVSGLTCWAVRPKDRGRLPVIVVNRDHGLESRRFTLAHELAHRVLYTVETVNTEHAVNRFAGAFLVPEDHLRRNVESTQKPKRCQLSHDEIIRLKLIYRVSAAAILKRLQQIGAIQDSAVQEAYQSFAKTWRRSEPQPIETDPDRLLEMPRRFIRLCYRALAIHQVSPFRAASLLRVPMNVIDAALRGPVEADAYHHH